MSSREPTNASKQAPACPPAGHAAGLIDCLLYPVSQRNGLVLLLVLPLGVSTAWVQFGMRGNEGIAQVVLFLFLLGFVLYGLLFVGRVLVASAHGQARHPRLWGWTPAVLLEGLGRWCWGCSFGLAIGGIPAVSYWVVCGDIDLVDRLLLLELASLGVIYTQLALAASLLHDDVWAANPLRIGRALRKVGKSYAPSCLVTTIAVLLVFFAHRVLLNGRTAAGSLGPLGALWLFSAFVFYEAMVVFRLLGVFCHRQEAVLGWSEERPSWGA